MSKIGIIVLAAGGSSRMGSPKQLLDFRGKPLIRRTVEAALESGCSPVVVVLGSRAGDVARALDGLSVRLAINPHWAEGMGTSIQAGLDELEGCNLDGVILMLGDQPLIRSRHLKTLVETQSRTGLPLVSARYAGTVGVPALFLRETFDSLRALEPAAGCKSVILSRWTSAAFVPLPEAAMDIDTPEDLERALSAVSE